MCPEQELQAQLTNDSFGSVFMAQSMMRFSEWLASPGCVRHALDFLRGQVSNMREARNKQPGFQRTGYAV